MLIQKYKFSVNPAGNYMFKETLGEGVKLRHWCRFGVFIVNFEHILHLVYASISIINFEHVIAG